MQWRQWPTFAKIHSGGPTVEAHSRGGENAGGHYSYIVGGGARIVWKLSVPPMQTKDALRFRAFLHSLRGAAGTLELVMPFAKPLPAFTAHFNGYTDGTVHTDDTAYDDAVSYDTAFFQSGTVAAAAAGAEVLSITGATPVVGEWLKVQTADGPQCVRVFGVAAPQAFVRPRLRAALTSSTVHVGQVSCTFRLVGNAPAVPLVNGRSLALDIELEEAR